MQPAAHAGKAGLRRRWLDHALALGEADPGPCFAWHSRVAFVLTLLSFLTLLGGAYVYSKAAPGVDFTSFWSAGHLAVTGHPALAYDQAVHRAVQMTVAHMGGAMPFPYPPPFLLVVMPIGFHPFWLAYLVWVAVGATLFLLATRRLMPATYALSHPAAFMNVVGGQNGFLTCSVFIAAFAALERRPLLAGALFGLFVCKPQLACLVPIAFIAGGHWRAFFAAAASGLLVLLLGLALFGVESYRGFFAMSAHFAGLIENSAWRWNQLASVFAFARFFGIAQGPAFVAQALAAIAAIVLTWRAWALKHDQRVPILAASTMLISPYLFTYDTLLLIIPLAAFLQQRQAGRFVAVWMGSFLTVLCFTGAFAMPIPNLTPIAAIASLFWLHNCDLRLLLPNRSRVSAAA
ncbi:glycosyltransferase family 87 protein [Sphingomonas sinipercae]|uniref:glycosyltransferase family 87 protein n=1 Tax=Sphingomonas sinipercae TaxID=2714944 RepID=UPI001FED0B8B|nr:glycosyltransferase family 87 protein [Sphingomonas sinipercae]